MYFHLETILDALDVSPVLSFSFSACIYSVCFMTYIAFKYMLRSLEGLYSTVAKYFIFQITLTYLDTDLSGNPNDVVKHIYF